MENVLGNFLDFSPIGASSDCARFCMYMYICLRVLFFSSYIYMYVIVHAYIHTNTWSNFSADIDRKSMYFARFFGL